MIIARFPSLLTLLFSSVFVVITFCYLSLISCSQIKKKTTFYPDEYQYPDSNLGPGKTFVYKNLSDTSILIFHDSKVINEQGNTYLIERQYDQTSTLDSEKYTVDKKLIECYIFSKSSPGVKLKGSILQNVVVDNGTRLGKRLSKTEFKDYDVTITFRNEEYFLKDTIINWNGQKLECLKTRLTEWIDLDNKREPSASGSSKRIGEGYFAKGIGLIRYHMVSETGSATLQLVEIRNMTRLEQE